MGKRPPKQGGQQGQKKKKKRSRVQRDYDDEADEMVEKAPQKGGDRTRGPRETQERNDAIQTRWVRNKVACYEQQKFNRFIKKAPPKKAPGLSSTQRRNRRRAAALGPPPVETWPTRREVKAAAAAPLSYEDAVAVYAGGDDAGEGDGCDSVSDPEDDDDDGDEDDEDDEDEAAEEDNDDDDEEEEAESGAEENDDDDDDDDDDVARARSALADAHFGAALDASEVEALGSRRPARAFAAVGATGGDAAHWRSAAPATVPTISGAADRLRRDLALGATATPRQGALLAAAASFADVLATNEGGADRSGNLRAALAHVLDHVVRSRSRQLRRDRRLRRAAAVPAAPGRAAAGIARSAPLRKAEPTERFSTLEEGERALGVGVGGDGDGARDQGLHRARALVLVPTRFAALEVARALMALVGSCVWIRGGARLTEELGADAGATREGPADWEAVFGGNCDDTFEMGIAVTPRRGGLALGFFADAERNEADVVVATPLALKLAIEKGPDPEARCLDRLSSIEVLLVDQADVLRYQNWDHVREAVGACNGPPAAVEADVTRARAPYLDGHGAAVRQTLVLARFADPFFRALLDDPPSGLLNRAGCVRLSAPPTAGARAALAAAARPGATHRFAGVRAASPAAAAAAKVAHFRDRVAPALLRKSNGPRGRVDGHGTVVYCATYHEFLAVRAVLRTAAAPYLAIHEYSRDSEVSRARSRFFHGQTSILLYSGRAHFYHRYRIRGASRFVFVSPPDHAHFYPELLALAPPGDVDATTLYTRFDGLALERILGASRARAILAEDAHGGATNHDFA